MEKLQGKLALVEATFNWDDIGSWESVWKNSIKDQLVKKLVVNSFNNHLINSNKSIFR